jgi:hypothetical protein
MTRSINFRWPDKFVEDLDEARGPIPRSAYVRAAIEAYELPWLRPAVLEAVEEQKKLEEQIAALAPELIPKRFKCRHCDFSASSPNARCPRHPGKLT